MSMNIHCWINIRLYKEQSLKKLMQSLGIRNNVILNFQGILMLFAFIDFNVNIPNSRCMNLQVISVLYEYTKF